MPWQRSTRPLVALALLLAASIGGVSALDATPGEEESQPETKGEPNAATPLPEEETLRILSRAEALLHLGQAESAARLTESLPTTGPHSAAIRRVRAWALLEAERYGDLVKLLAPEPTLSGEFLYLRGTARLGSGKYKALGLADLRTLWWHEPDGPWGLAALRQMAVVPRRKGGAYSNRERELIKRQVNRPSGAWGLVSKAAVDKSLDGLAKGAPRRSLLQVEIHHAVGHRFLRAEEFTLAVKELRLGLSFTKNRELRRVMRLRLGQALRRRGSYTSARRHFDQVAAAGSDRWSQQALALAGQMAIEYRRYDEARQRFQAQLVQNPIGPARHNALWGLGWVAFRTGDYRAARRFFGTLSREAPYSPSAPGATYWSARALEELGDRTSARAELTALLKRFPLDYYAYRARTWIRGSNKVAPAVLPSGTSHPEVAHLRSVLEADMQRRAKRLLPKLKTLADGISPEDLNFLKEASQTLGLKSSTLFFSYRRQRRFPDGANGRNLLRSLFPRSYASLIARQAERQKLDPALLAGLARQESAFNARAVSSAGALGLLQLMPKTAEGLLLEEGTRTTKTPDGNIGHTMREKILNPKVNTRLGARYLGRLLRSFNGRVEYALAAYNAGPGAVTRWLQTRGDLPVDIFAEEIPYSETRRYVRRVLSWREVYRYINDNEPSSLALR